MAGLLENVLMTIVTGALFVYSFIQLRDSRASYGGVHRSSQAIFIVIIVISGLALAGSTFNTIFSFIDGVHALL